MTSASSASSSGRARMERHMCMWRGVDRLAFGFGDKPNGIVNRLASVGDHVFVATTANDLYHGEVEFPENEAPRLTLKRAQFDVVDMAANSEHLFVVNASGHVLKVDPQDLSVLDTIVLREEVKCCVHGYKLENETVKVKSLAVSDNSALFVTESGQLWASGNQPQIDVTSQEPRKVTFFEGRTVSQVSCGSNFHLVTARRNAKSLKDDTDSENELEEVFVNSCPQCVSNVMPSPTSLTSSDTCPMLHSQQFSENRSTNSLSGLSTGSRDPEATAEQQRTGELENGDYSTPDLTDLSKDDRRNNVIFINTEAARQFLTRQLSWVSSYGSVKDDSLPLENMDRPTRLIKQNVSNMASFVYEGVKNVGGKVVTLSRHMSGSSEINDIRDQDEAATTSEGTTEEDPGQNKPAAATSLALSLRCEEFPWSSSTESSEHELSQQGLNERINVLARAGTNLLATETWAWGDVQYGQLGTGDIIKRARPVNVAKLGNTGIRKIDCGDYHALALTLDGRVFAWGRNNFKQVTPNVENDQSAPQFFATELAEDERAKDMAAGACHSLVMMHHGLYFVGRSSKPGEMFQLDVQTSPDQSVRQILSSGRYSCCSIVNQPPVNVSEDLARDQIFLEEILTVYQYLVKPLQKRGGGATTESNVYETLCRCYTELMSFTVLNVVSLWDYMDRAGEAYEVMLVANIEEYTAVYRYYINAICDVLAIGGFAYIAKITDLPQPLTNLFAEKLKSSDTKKNSSELVIGLALQHPLRRLSRYKSTIQSLIRTNGTRMGLERLQEALIKWEQVCEEQEKRQREAEATRLFWESSGKLLDVLRSPQRRLIRESRSNPITMLNSGRFSSHWFVLLTDIFIHVTGASHTVHPLRTMWVEPLSDTDNLQNAISVVTPEDNLVLLTPTAAERSDWLHALQNAIKCSLQRPSGPASHAPPIARTGSFTFIKQGVFKDAKYTGRWLNGKPHGSGRLEWSDSRVYVGQFHKGVIQGNGRMEIPSQGVYEGQWKDGQQNGYGTMKYVNGDFYEGYFKDGLPHGHGVKKEGHFMASVASVYIGEWAAGMKQGYGIMDDIMTGEKYLGSWNNGMKHGCGLIVTLDGIYYEGVFMQDVLTGHGIMIFEDGTHYEGEFKSAGIFYGKGTLTFRSGDRLEGNMNGAWNEGVKVIATLHMNKASSSHTATKPVSFGKLCVSPDQKWKAIFRQCYQQLGIPEVPARGATLTERSSETQRVWQNVAALITKSHQRTVQKKKLANDGKEDTSRETNIDQLDKIPCFGRDKLSLDTHLQVRDYLTRAFESPHHPLGALLTEVAAVYTATYGGVRVHPLLLSHAVSELHSITTRIYDIVTRLFPALPPAGKEFVLEGKDDEEQVITPASILHPILLPRVHSALFVLYALHNKKEDDAYWERLIKWNKQPDVTLMAFLEIDPKFWKSAAATGSPLPSQSTEPLFSNAVETLQQLKTTFSPLEKLQVVRNTFEQMTQAVQRQLGSSYLWTMDELFPVFSFVVVRASVLQLGSEIHFIEDFMESYLQNGELGIMFTTLKACYYQILQEKTNMAD